MRYIWIIIVILILSSCKKEQKFEVNGLVLIDRSGTIDFAKESGIDTVTLVKEEDGTYRIAGFGSQPKMKNRISVHVNELKEK